MENRIQSVEKDKTEKLLRVNLIKFYSWTKNRISLYTTDDVLVLEC